MKLNAEVLAGMQKMNLYENRRVTDLVDEKSGTITTMGFFDGHNLYVDVTFDDGKHKEYSSKDFGNLYVYDEKPDPPSKDKE